MKPKEQQQLIIVLGLVAVLIMLSLKAAQDIKKTKSKVASKTAALIPAMAFSSASPAPSGSKGSGPSKELYMSLSDEMKTLRVTRDPFGVPAKEDEEKGIGLSGIFWDAHEPKAIINGDVVWVGDRVQNFTVQQIFKDRVILVDGTTKMELSIGP